jgi:hypothetical protein
MVPSKMLIKLREWWRTQVLVIRKLRLRLHPDSAKEEYVCLVCSRVRKEGIGQAHCLAATSASVSLCFSNMCLLYACQFSCLSAHTLGSWTVSCPSWCSFLPQAALEHTTLLSVHPPFPKLHSLPKQHHATSCHGEQVILLGPRSMESIQGPFLSLSLHIHQDTGSCNLCAYLLSVLWYLFLSGFFWKMNLVGS